MKLVVIDGQSGRTGALLVERVRAAGLPLELLAVGTNAIATAAMMKAGAQRGATGENPVLVACRDANIIAGPIGILMADALMGEITPAMAVGFYTGDAMEMGSRYLEALHTFFGIGAYTCIAADGMNVAGFDAEASLRRAMQEAAQLAASL